MIELFAQAATAPGTAGTDWWDKGATFLVGAIGGWISGTIKVRGQQRQAIDRLVEKLISLAMEYPHLERDAYCAKWAKDGADDDERVRYENYCCLVFNTIEHAWELAWPWWFSNKLRHRAVRKIVQIEEWICRHHLWWEGDPDNLEGYSDGFKAYMHYVLDDCRKGKRI